MFNSLSNTDTLGKGTKFPDDKCSKTCSTHLSIITSCYVGPMNSVQMNKVSAFQRCLFRWVLLYAHAHGFYYSIWKVYITPMHCTHSTWTIIHSIMPCVCILLVYVWLTLGISDVWMCGGIAEFGTQWLNQSSLADTHAEQSFHRWCSVKRIY